MKHFDCIVAAHNIQLFHHILRQGVGYRCQLPMSIKDFLVAELELTPQQVECEIRTVFLNNSPVDNLDKALLGPDSVLALGTAMPGLVGITMACSSPFSGFRDDISATQKSAEDTAGPRKAGRIRLKLFSFVASMCGSKVLEKGVFVAQDKLRGLLQDLDTNMGEELQKHLVSLTIDGRTVSVRTFLRETDPGAYDVRKTPNTPAHEKTDLIRLTCRETRPSEDHAHAKGN